MKIIQTRMSEESRILNVLREQYEADGYNFYKHPSRNLLPNDLDGFQPDAMAISEDEKIIIEVVSKLSKQKSRQLDTVAKVLKNESEWKFRLVIADNFDLGEVSSRKKATLKSIQSSINRIEKLETYEFLNEGFLLQWSVLEAISVHLIEKLNAGNTNITSMRWVLSFLEQEGHLSFRDTKALRKLLDIRNVIVHGGLSVNVSKKEYSKLDGLVRSLFSEIMD